MSKDLEKILTVKCNESSLDEFRAWCKKAGVKPSDFLRDMMKFAVSGKLRIVDEDRKNIMEGIYVVS